MSNPATGRIVDAASNGDLRITPPADQAAEVGERFCVLNEQGEPIAEIKVIRSDASGTIARYFQPFVSDEALRNASAGTAHGRASSAAAGAAAGAILGSPLPLVGTMAGAAIGAMTGVVLRSALARRSPRQPIQSGMVIVPIVGLNKSVKGSE
jgi:hypothetical protein